MKKMLLTILFVAGIVVAAKDTTSIKLQDTLITKTVDSSSFFDYNFWQTLISVSIGSILTLLGVYFSNKHQKKLSEEQIKHQLRVSQADIDVASKRKLIEDLISICRIISSSVYSLISMKISQLSEIVNLNNDFETINTGTSSKEPNIQEVKNRLYFQYISKHENLFSDMFVLHRELYANMNITQLYIPKSHPNYIEIKDLAKKLLDSFDEMVKFGFDVKLQELKLPTDYEVASKNLDASKNDLINKIEMIINDENEIINEVLIKKAGQSC